MHTEHVKVVKRDLRSSRWFMKDSTPKDRKRLVSKGVKLLRQPKDMNLTGIYDIAMLVDLVVRTSGEVTEHSYVEVFRKGKHFYYK